NANNQLNTPADVYLDIAGNIYIADKSNHRIQKWVPGATSGTTVAGTGTSGNGNDQLNNPTGIYVDGAGNIYITYAINQRVQFRDLYSTTISMLEDHKMSYRPAPATTGVALDSAGNMYMSDLTKYYVLQYSVKLTDTLLVITPATYKLVVKGFAGC